MDNEPLELLPIITALVMLVTNWTEEEKEALVAFLVDEKITGKMGNGSFKSATWSAAAAHINKKFLKQKGVMKTSDMCRGKLSNLKSMLRDINLWQGRSGKHWDNENGANIISESEESDFKEWLAFKNVGWPLLMAMELLFPNDQARGMHAYHPTTSVAFVSGASGPGLSINLSSHTSSDPVMTPSTSSTALQFITPQVGSSAGIIEDDAIDQMSVDKVAPANRMNVQSQLFSMQFNPPMLTLTSPMMLLSSYPPSTTSSMPSSRKHTHADANPASPSAEIPSVQAALQSLSIKDDAECSSKKLKKSKEMSTPALLVGVQGSLSYLGSVISSLSAVAAQQRHTEHMHATMEMLAQQDDDLPLLAKTALMEAFCMDGGAIDLYLMLDDKTLRRNWIQTCLRNQKLIPDDLVL
ncbi:hypothetical protein M404DRAFT_27178 [Pisolithus tinctorius Marx 270]|uniref:Myb/SANT-like domain-containing protein n=1 Tax=Pisolithus tinctorius Marx 270 TaxID=870435 RepID=A0A0C3P6J0_PISTI|nr:hypothetical protein M404DRAFT_27178 [Pisolithus tinctorius Marx 270]